MRSFIDANFIIKAYSRNPDNEKCRKILNNGGLLTNPIAVVEAWQSLMHILGTELANKAILDLLRSDVDIMKLDSSVIHDAVKLQQKCGLDAFDTTHLVSAQLSGCSEILTFDKDFLNIKTEPAARIP